MPQLWTRASTGALTTLLVWTTAAPAQDAATRSNETDYRTEMAHPRLLLPPRRARLLKREREREAMRWAQFHTLMISNVRFPEPGLAHALYYVASEDREHARKAIEFALTPASDLRQTALVFDWCQAVLTEDESRRLMAKMSAALEKAAAAADLATVRSRILAAVALTDHIPDMPARHIRPVVEQWWPKHVSTPIKRGEIPIAQKDFLALMEMLHVLRDNIDVELRETNGKFFATLPVYHLLSHYPAPFPGSESEYRLPLMAQHGEPNLMEAVLSRAAALAMVAYDTNSQEMQFLQGWLIQDRYLMRGAAGIPYEFLWANPYQPGLSFHYLPNIYHDPSTGRLIIRSTWDDDATWYYQSGGVMQMFRNAQIVNVKAGELKEPVVMGNTVLLTAALAPKFTVAAGSEKTRYYIIGLKPRTRYEIEVDDEELREVSSDFGGVLDLEFPPGRNAGVLLRESRPLR